MDSPPVEPKKRIRVACHSCRRKKIKCDGANPCAHCVFSKDVCVYAERPTSSKRVRSNTSPEDSVLDLPEAAKRTKLSSTKLLAKKVDTMEKSLSMLSAKIDALVSLATGGTMKKPESPEGSDEEDSESGAGAASYSKERKELSSVKSSSFGGNFTVTGTALKDGYEKYFGAHSVFCIFSESSLDWMARLLEPLPGGEDAVTAVRNFPRAWYTRNQPLLAMWIDPPLINAAKKIRMLERPFSNDRNYIVGLLDSYYSQLHALSELCPAHYVISLFDEYYSISSTRAPRRHSALELLIMTTLISLAICCKASFERPPTPTSDVPGNGLSGGVFLNVHEKSLFTELMNNAIFYYQRISVISEGIESIQGILLLMCLIDTNWSGAPFSYTLALLAIRHAQDMGLHRFDSYLAVSPEEVKKRRTVWSCCQMFDIETCYRFGKAPLINMADALMSEGDLIKATAESQLGGIHVLAEERKMIESDTALAVALWRISCVRYKLYHLLFVASPHNESYPSMATTLDLLNDEMFAIAASVDIKDRPLFSKDPNFAISDAPIDRRRSQVLYLHFVFFFHLLVINRLPSLAGPLGLDVYCADAAKYRDLSHDSARTILVLATQISRKNCDIMFFNWMLFFILTAYLHILASVLNFPDHPETHLDIYLLVNALMNFFSAPENNRCEFLSDKRHPSSKNAIVSLLACAVLQVCIIYYEHKTGNQVASLIPGLAEHLKTPRETAPELYAVRKPSDGFMAPSQTTIRASTVYPFTTASAPSPDPFHNMMMPIPPIQPNPARDSKFNHGSSIASYPPSFTRSIDGRNPSANVMMPPLPPMSPRFTDRVHSPYSYGSPVSFPPMSAPGTAPIPFFDDHITNKLFPQMHTSANFFIDNSMALIDHE